MQSQKQNTFALTTCPFCQKSTELPLVLKNDEYIIGSEAIYHLGNRLDVMPSCLRLLKALVTSETMELPISQLAELMESQSQNPKNLIAVLVYSLRKSTNGKMPIDSCGGSIVWTGQPFEISVDPTAACDECWTKPISFSSNAVKQRRRLKIGEHAIDLTEQEYALVSTLSANPQKIVRADTITRAMGSRSSDHSNVVKTILCTTRRAFQRAGLKAPIRTIRGKGLIWDPRDLLLFTKKDVADSNAQKANADDRPVSHTIAVGNNSSGSQSW